MDGPKDASDNDAPGSRRTAPARKRVLVLSSDETRCMLVAALESAGIRVTEHIPTTSGVCVRTMAGIYLSILERIERDPQLPLQRRASLSPAVKLGVMARSWLAAV